jgi:hypothetical protein
MSRQREMASGSPVRGPASERPSPLGRRLGRLTIHAAAAAGLALLLAVVWATTTRAYFWPIQALLPVALTLTIHAWIVLLADRPGIRGRFLGSESLAVHVGVSGALWVYLVSLWLVGDRGYFWPGWALLGLAVLAGGHAVEVVGRRTRAEEADDRLSSERGSPS